MPRGKGRVITKSIKDQNISDMFNQMIGAGGLNLNVVYPKYKEMGRITSQLIKLLGVFHNGVFLKSIPDAEKARQEIADFIETCNAEQEEIFQFQDIGKYQGMYDMLSDDVKDNFAAKYEKVKDSHMVKTFVVVCDKLVEYKRHIENPAKLSYKFINTMPGVEFMPLPFTSLNFKYLFSMDTVDERGREYLMLILNKIYTLTYRLYQEFSKPDIDVDEFVKVILANMDEVKKQVPRCGKAFRKIAESVELLKGNFGGYYRDFVQTKNSSIIMEHFVLDVSKETDADPETTNQFRRIINYYRKMTAGKIKDPRVNYLFKKVDASFSEMDRFSNMQKDKAGEFDGDSSDESDDVSDNASGDSSNDASNDVSGNASGDASDNASSDVSSDTTE